MLGSGLVKERPVLQLMERLQRPAHKQRDGWLALKRENLVLALEDLPLRAQEGTPMPPGVAAEARAALRSNPNHKPNHDPNPSLGCALTLG